MKVIGTAEVLTQSEIDQISQSAKRILANVGVRMPNERVLMILAEHGARVDFDRQMVYFPETLIEQFLSDSQPEPIDTDCTLYFMGGAYPQYYHDPYSGKIYPQTWKTVEDMTHLANSLKNIDIVYDSMGVPSDVPDELAPLYMRLIIWKHTNKGGCGQVQLSRNLPYVLEMSEVMAEASGKSLSEFAFLTFQMISPLQFGKEELEQFLYFWERGLPAFPGQILSAGGTAPVTLAGTLALQLAESLVVNLMGRVFYGRRSLHFSNSATVFDLKKGVFQYGRPELGITHLAFGQIARHFGARFEANSFLGDAKAPSCEMGMQKAINSIPAIMAGSHHLGTLGLLSVDEIGSPLQLIIDDEYAGALRRFARGFEVNEETLAYSEICEAGPGGLFAGTEHTVRHYRKEQWQPTLFSREAYNTWVSGDQKIDVDRALDVYNSVMKSEKVVYIRPETESELMKVIQKARQALG